MKMLNLRFILFICIIGLAFTPPHFVHATNWLNDYQIRRAIVIHNPGGSTLTDYQILINVSYDSEMQLNFDDLRFTDSDGVTKLSYWIESYVAGVSARIWVKVPQIQPNGNTTIYMYYGNPSASSQSNGTATFDFFDDFGSDSSLDTSKWEEIATGATVDWSSDKYVEITSSGYGADWWIRTKQNNSVNFIAEFKLNIISFSGSSRKFLFRIFDETNTLVDNPINWGTYDWSSAPDGDLSTGVRWFKVVLKSDGWITYSRASLSDPWSQWRSGSWNQDLLKPSLHHMAGTSGYHGALTERWYCYFHRKYADPEPVVSSIGAEERMPVGIETSTGVGEATFTSSSGLITNLTAIDEQNLPSEGAPNLEFPYGFFAFNITGLTPGEAVNVTITLPSPLPEGSQYWKCQNNIWYQIPVGDNDGDEIIIITLQDGGIGDGDGIINGVISDPGAPGYKAPSPVGGTIMPANHAAWSPTMGDVAFIALILFALSVTGTLVLIKRKH